MTTTVSALRDDLLPNGDFTAGMSGWTWVEIGAAGCWCTPLPGGGLQITAAGAVTTPAGTVMLFSARVPAADGTWRAGVELTAAADVTVDLAVVADTVVAVPGPAPSVPPRRSERLSAGQTTVLESTRAVARTDRTVGVRLSLPAGIDVVVHRVWLQPPAGAQLPSPLPRVVAVQSTEPFRQGAIVPVGAPLRAHLHGDLTGVDVSVADVYRDRRRALQPTVDGDEVCSLQLPTDTVGVFAVEVRRGAASETAFRYAVDVAADPPAPDPASPWALTAGMVNPTGTAALLRAMGIAHTRIYSGFGVLDLPVVTDVSSAEAADALLAAYDFTGVATGSAACAAAGSAGGSAAAGRDAQSGWPRWRSAATVADDAPADRLRPVAGLLDPFAGTTVLAETSNPADAGTARAVVSAVAQGLRDRRVAWTVANEPDLGGAWTPEQWAARQREFTAAVRAADPDALVVGPTIADGWDGCHQGLSGWAWLDRWAAAGGLAQVDVVNLHLHMLDEETSTPEREHLELLLRRFRDLLARHGRPDMPVWVTEMGWRGRADDGTGMEAGETGTSVAEADQADLLLRAGLLAVASGVSRFYFFHLHGFRWFGEGNRFDWGVVAGMDAGPKAAFLALRHLVRVTAGAHAFELLPVADRARVVLADCGDRWCAYAWQWSGGPGLFTLDDPPPGVSVTDALGAATGGDDLRRPVVVCWSGARATGEQWLRRRLRERFTTT